MSHRPNPFPRLRSLKVLETPAALAASSVVAVATAKELILARSFGLDAGLDRFLVLSSVPLALISLYAASYRSAATPLFIHRGSSVDQRRSTSYILPVVLWAGFGAVVALGWVLAAEPIRERPLLPVVSLTGALLLGTVGAAIIPLLLASNRPVPAIAGPVWIPLTLAATVIVFGAKTTPLYLGFFGGAALGLVWYAYFLHRSGQSIIGVRLFRHEARQLHKDLTLVGASSLASYMLGPIDIAFASTLGDGAASAFSFATRPTLAVCYVAGAVISSVAFPTVLRVLEAANRGAIRAIVQLWTIRLIVIGSLATLVFLMFAEQITLLLYGDEQFSPGQLSLMANLHRVIALSIIPFALAVLYARTLNAIGKNGTLLLISPVVLGLNLAGNWALRIPFGLAGIAVATVVGHAVAALLMYRAVARNSRWTHSGTASTEFGTLDPKSGSASHDVEGS